VLSDKLQERVLLDVLERAGLTGPDQSPKPSRKNASLLPQRFN
jgi:hypothetical protein